MPTGSAIARVPNGVVRPAPGSPPRGDIEGCMRGAAKEETPGTAPGIGADIPALVTAEEASVPGTLNHNDHPKQQQPQSESYYMK